jgi:hypothetical protein
MDAEENANGMLQRHMLRLVWSERESHEELSHARLEANYRSTRLAGVFCTN